jgi:hypothetical protein
LVLAASVDDLLGLRHEPDYALEGKIWRPRVPVALARAQPPTFEGEITAVVARIIGAAAARDESAEAQAEQVLDELNRRGLLRDASKAARSSGTTAETPCTACHCRWFSVNTVAAYS